MTGADILVVDDTPANLTLLSGMLKDRGYKVRPAPSGRLALQAARQCAPDLILLDISMPEMSGYEVAEELELDAALRDVPIIFLSALGDTEDKVRAFAVGGVDYITKPFQFEEVLARVSTHVRLRRMKAELVERSRSLEQANQELRRAQLLRDNLTQMIVHDLRAPLSVIVSYIDLLLHDGSALPIESLESVRGLRVGSRALMNMVSSLLDVAKMEAGKLVLRRAPTDLGELAANVLGSLDRLRRGISVEASAPSDPVLVSVDQDLLFRVIQNLVVNAIKFTPNGGAVRVRVERDESGAKVSVVDTGRGIPPQFHERIFEKFAQVEADGPNLGTGLGLTFCRMAVEAHGGRIGVESEVGHGSTFWFVLPDPN